MNLDTFYLEWWAWGVAAALFAILEMIAPGYIFLGFAVGAGAVAAGLGLGLLPLSFPALMLIFALLSAAAWVIVRQLMGVRRGQVKTFDHDINED